jgi:hypothetical protein
MTVYCKGYSNCSVLMELLTSAKPCDIKIDSDHEVTVNPLSGRTTTGELTCSIIGSKCRLTDLSGIPVARVIEAIVPTKSQVVLNYKITRLAGSSGDSRISTVLKFKDSLDIIPGFPHTEDCEYYVRLV